MSDTLNPFDFPPPFREELFPTLEELSSELEEAGYRLLEPLGKGGSGHVFLAEDLNNNSRKVAIKFLRPEALLQEGFLKRFQAEAAILRRLNHENVVRVFENAITVSGHPYFVMEFHHGETLESYLRKSGRLTINRILRIIRDIANGIRHAHNHNILHRDIKPSNIMVAKGERTIVLDFGIALDPDPFSTQTTADSNSGTPGYIAPELLSGGMPTVQSDIYSLGVILCELLTGKAPRISGDLPSEYGLSADWDTVLKKALNQNPDNRHVNVDAFLRDLESTHKQSRANRRSLTFLPWIVAIAAVLALCVSQFNPFGALPTHQENYLERAHSLYGGSHLLANVIQTAEYRDRDYVLSNLKDAKRRLKLSGCFEDLSTIFPLPPAQLTLLDGVELKNYAKRCHQSVMEELSSPVMER